MAKATLHVDSDKEAGDCIKEVACAILDMQGFKMENPSEIMELRQNMRVQSALNMACNIFEMLFDIDTEFCLYEAENKE